VNAAPSADAGADQSVTENTTAQLDGQGSDPEGGTVSYAWSQVSGPNVTFSSTSDPDPTVDIPQVAIGEVDDIVLALTVRDPQGASATDQVTISAASADFVVFLADKDVDDVMELYKYDTQSDTLSKLSGTLVTGGRVLSFSLSPDGRFVAYFADQDTDDVIELYVAATDGSAVTKVSQPLASGGSIATRPFAWSPDSAQLAYLGDPAAVSQFDLYTVAPDGSGTTKVNGPLIAGSFISSFQWSPLGTQIAYTADAEILGVSEVYLVDSDGNNFSKINGSVGSPPSVYLDSISWSPDGRYIAQRVVQINSFRSIGINTHDTSTGTVNSVRINPAIVANGSIVRYEWSPDSSRVTYMASLLSAGTMELFSVRPDGSDHAALNLTLATGGNVSTFQWAPDGSRIAYSADQETFDSRELFTVNPDGSGNIKVSGPMVAGGGGMLFSFHWSPDSSRIAYTNDQDVVGSSEAYVSTADGMSNIKLNGPLIANGNAFVGFDNQGWAPDSQNLMYAADSITDNVFELFASDTGAATSMQVTRTPVAGGSIRTFGRWSADSSRIIYNSPQETAGVFELYMASPDGLSNQKISGQLVMNGNVDPSRFFWSP